MLKFMDYRITWCVDARSKSDFYKLTHLFYDDRAPHIVISKEYLDLPSYQAAKDKHENMVQCELWGM